MRDVKRIEPTLAKIREYWYQHPDLRLSQILAIMAKGDPFYMEEETLIQRLDEANKQDYIAEMKELVANEDHELAHIKGEEILCKILITEGYEDLINEYKKIPKW